MIRPAEDGVWPGSNKWTRSSSRFLASSHIPIFQTVEHAITVWLWTNQTKFSNHSSLTLLSLPISKNNTMVECATNDLTLTVFVPIPNLQNAVRFQMIFMCFSFFSVFKAAPPLPPTTARILPTASSEETYGSSIKRLVTNKSYMTLLITYGINAGVFYAMSTLLNQIVLNHYPVSRNYFKSCR